MVAVTAAAGVLALGGCAGGSLVVNPSPFAPVVQEYRLNAPRDAEPPAAREYYTKAEVDAMRAETQCRNTARNMLEAIRCNPTKSY